MKLVTAQSIAQDVVDMLKPACRLIEIAGSVRRRKPEVGDIEIVALPLFTVSIDLFGAEEQYSALEDHIGELLESGDLTLDKTLRRNGPLYKRFTHGVAIDLFIAQQGNYGNILALRTGDSAFSRALVTERRAGGLMPSYLRQRDGFLWRGKERIDCPDELTYFDALGFRLIDPPARTWPLNGGIKV